MPGKFLLALPLLLTATPALAAAPNLVVSVAPPTGTMVYATGRTTVTVANTGNKDSTSVTLTIQLPATHTSPQVYVMGNVIALSGCTQSGTALTCGLGIIRKNHSTQVWFDLQLPESSAPLAFSANAPQAGDSNPANNSASWTVDPVNYANAVTSGGTVTNSHCTGTGLTAFFECTKFPGSISFHDTVLNGDGSISFPGQDPGYGGSWSQPTAQSLHFVYTYGGSTVATFDGNGVDGGCWEGVTTFPNSSYVSPYEVCPQ